MSQPASGFRAAPGVCLPTDGGRSVILEHWTGEGSFAHVFGGLLRPPGARCAVKIAKAEVSGALERMRVERRVLSAARHSRLVELLDAAAGFLVLEWLEGERLRDRIAAHRRLPLRQALRVLQEVTEALAALHSGGEAHGDLRSENVLLVGSRGAMLVDPGPTDPGAAGQAADVRGAGNLLHEMLTGAPPTPDSLRLTRAAGYNRLAVALFESTRGDRPPAPSVLLREISSLLAAL